MVLQENVLFNRTIHENIAFANPGMSRVDVIRVAKLAGADEFISALPQGYDSIIEERGGNLSGGSASVLRLPGLWPPIHPCLFLMRQPAPLIMKVKILSEKT